MYELIVIKRNTTAKLRAVLPETSQTVHVRRPNCSSLTAGLAAMIMTPWIKHIRALLRKIATYVGDPRLEQTRHD